MKKEKKPECRKSPTGKHVWEKTEEDRVKWPRGDWGCVPGIYCIHCGECLLLPNFGKRGGLVTVVVQDIATKEILMVAFTDQAGFLETLTTGEAVYYSTSRKERWKKGETSGNYQMVRSIKIDCDGDALIYIVEQKGKGACHTGNRSCFFRTIKG